MRSLRPGRYRLTASRDDVEFDPAETELDDQGPVELEVRWRPR